MNPPPRVSPPPLPRGAGLPGRLLSTRTRPPILTPEELERFKDLFVFARSTVEGYFAGKHKSSYRGASAEFADYKEYVAGDDVSQLDWRVYGRTRRLFLRQFEAETDMVAYLLLDVSASMSYAGAGRQTKFLVAAKVAAVLAYLMMNQGDKASLTLFAETIRDFIPPGGTRRHLHRMVSALEQAEPSHTTGIAQAIGECVSLFRKRGRLIVISDFLTDQSAFLDAIGQFLHRKFDILLLHVVDPDELHLPAGGAARFVDMETGETVEVETEEIQAVYRKQVRASLDDLAREASQRRIEHSLVHTDRPYLEAIEAYLGLGH